MYKKLVWVIMAVVFLGNIVTDSQSISEYPVITTDNASQVELLHVIGGGKILDILWSPDGESLFVANQKMIRLFNAQNLAETPILIDQFACVDDCEIELSFADEFQTFVALRGIRLAYLGYDPYITHWDIASQHLIEDYNGEFDIDELRYERQVLRDEGNPSPIRINSLTLELYDEAIADYVTLQGDSFIMVDAVFNADRNKIASIGNDGIIEIWDVATRTSQLIAQDLRMSLTAVQFSPDSTKLVVGGWDGSLWIFDVATGELLDSLTEDWWVNWSISFNHDGSQLALGNDNNQVILYDVVSDYPFLTNRRVFEGHTNIVYGVDFHPDGTQLASASADGKIHIWDIETGIIVHTITGSSFFDVDFHPDGTKLACATQSGYAIIPVTAINCESQQTDLRTVYSVLFSPDGEFFTYGDTNIVTRTQQQYSQSSNIELATLRAWSDKFASFRTKLTFSDDGLTLLNGGAGQRAYVWHMDDLDNPFVVSDGLMALSPDGSLIAGNGLRIFDIHNKVQIYPIEDIPSLYTYLHGYTSGQVVMDATFSPDGRWIITAPTTGGLAIWGIQSAD
jgi:WD40 repeat protein